METAALCKPIQRFADLLRIPGTWVLTGLGQLLAALGSFPHFPQPLRLLHTHLYWRFLECQSIEVTLTQNGHLTHHEIPSVASLRPGGHFPRIGWPVSPEYAAKGSRQPRCLRNCPSACALFSSGADATCSRDCQDWRINLAQAAPESCRRPKCGPSSPPRCNGFPASRPSGVYA